MKRFLDKLIYIIILLLFLTIVSISAINYLRTKDVIEDKYSYRQALVEKSILRTINHINDTYKIAEQQLNQEMKNYSHNLREKYKTSSDVMNWDLKALKEEFGIYDIYIIDNELKIINTTLEKDLGLDFSKYAGFSKVLRNRLEGDSFVVDRIDLSTTGGEVKKYSYLPTHDNKYLLELSIEVKERYPTLQELDVFVDATTITEDYEIVEEISFFSVEPVNHGVAKLRSSVKPYLSPKISGIEKDLARQSVLSSKVQSTIIHTEETNYPYKFFPVIVSGETSEQQWNSYVVGIKYNDGVMIGEINKHRRLFLINAAIITVVFVLFLIAVIHLLRNFEQLAYYDHLTGLASRKLFEKEYDKSTKDFEKNGKRLIILFIDIDNFKEVNDNFGHDTGDKMLIEVANRLNDIFRKSDTICRLGGDEFAVAVTGISSKEEAAKVADKVVREFNKPIIINDNKYFIDISVGISVYQEDGTELEELMKKADFAMYEAKRKQHEYIIYNYREK